MANSQLSVALHGGAGAKRGHHYRLEIAYMRGLIESARDRLLAGATAVDVAVETVQALELSGLYVAGRGASANTAGRYELDASLMDGATGRAGAVAALQGFQSPIAVARRVMDATPHVLLVGDGASRFAAEQGMAAITDPDWFTHAGTFEDNHPPGVLAHGTVGCVVCDEQGRLAGATSTGGVFGKLPGRVGDSPIIGAGTWSDEAVAVSCTGQGEYFLRVSAAAQLGFRVRFLGETVGQAAQAVLAQIQTLGGDGGLIAVDGQGQVAMPYVSQGMKRATWTSRQGEVTAAAFDD